MQHILIYKDLDENLITDETIKNFDNDLKNNQNFNE